MTVCADLIGRLGNNLFQISFAVGYAEKYRVEFVIPQWEYANYFKTNFTAQAKGTNTCGENGFHYQEFSFIEDVMFYGFFQSEKYFKHCEAKIRDLFQFNEKVTEPINKKYEAILKAGTICSIHVRRGDYIGNIMHEVCFLEYYQDAINEIKKRTKVDLFLVFSDDIPWCKEHLNRDDVLFAEGNSNIEDLFLMSQCTHNIICNSTFSWWGAWLNANKNKIVIAPGRWFNDSTKNTKDLLPEEWIKVPVKEFQK